MAFNAQTQAGPDLEEIQTEAVGFLSLGGDTKIRLLPTSWPSDALPPPTASLLSVASNKGLIAAAAPDSLILATTDSVRKAYSAEGPSENNVKPFSPQATIPVPRVSQVAFTADENYLVICADNGGGLAVYSVAIILQGSKEPSFQLGTNGIGVRALIPNPASEFAHYVAIILADGVLVLADLQQRQLVNGQHGPQLKDGVSCVSWSSRGKQLVAGLGNGTAFQMTPDGTGKAEIPRPPQLEDDQHVSAISWLANDTFLTIHTPSLFDRNTPPASNYHLVNRQKGTSNYLFQKLQDPCPPFGVNRSPPHFFIQRLRDFPPNLTDAHILSSTTSSDVGLITNSKAPLTSDVPADRIVNVYTTTAIALDPRRAQLPVTEEMADTSPIGVALDLSSRDIVKRPIPTEEIESTSGPLPALMLLNNEGVLSSWWVVYNESVRQNTLYPGLVAAAGVQQTQSQQQATQPTSVFGTLQGAKPAFGQTSGFGKPAAPAFGSTSTPGGAFGTPSMPGSNRSVWGTPNSTSAAQTGGATFGKPAFGSTTALGATAGGFGSLGGLGNRASPWTTTQTGSQTVQGASTDKPANPFAGGSTTSASPFASLANSGSTASPFAAVANADTVMGSPDTAGGAFGAFGTGGGFAGLGAGTGFGSNPAASSFGVPSALGGNRSPWAAVNNAESTGGIDTSLGKAAVNSAQSPEATMEDGDAGVETEQKGLNENPASLGKPTEKDSGLLVRGTSGLKLGSKGDGSAKADQPTSDAASGDSMFGKSFENALGEAQKAPVTPLKKEPGTEDEPKLQEISTTPASPPPQPRASGSANDQGKTNASRPAPHKHPSVQELHKVGEDNKVKERVQQFERKRTPSAADTPETQKATSQEIPPMAGSPPVDFGEPGSSPPSSLESPLVQVEDAPLPPDFLTPTPQAAVSAAEDAPLPPDSLTPTPKAATSATSAAGEAPLPSDFTEEASPSDRGQPGLDSKPAWSFDAVSPSEQEGAASTTPIRSLAPKRRPASLFLSKDAPVFAPPNRDRESRSPSPVHATPRIIRSSTSTISSRPLSRQISRPPSTGLKTPKNTSALAPSPRPQPREEEIDIVDDEDERIRDELASDVMPVRTLDAFIAHQDYVSQQPEKPGIPGQIERVYRDINSMVNTLGLNARSLNAFIRGHEEGFRDEITTENLEDEEGWVLVETDDLIVLEGSLERDIERGRVKEVGDKGLTLKAMSAQMAKVRTKLLEVRRVIDAKTDEEQVMILKAAPLSAEQSLLRQDLRRDVARFQKLLADAEEGVSLLQAKLATAGWRGSASDRGPAQQQPTVEAVMSTIAKMTSMVEKRSGDVDVLEMQMRRLKLGPGLNGSHGGASREGSPFVTPRAGKSSLPLARSSARPTPGTGAGTGTYSLTYSPSSSVSDPARKSAAMRSSGISGAALGASASGASPARKKKMSQVSDGDVQAWMERARRRQKARAALREAVMKKGVRVTGAGD